MTQVDRPLVSERMKKCIKIFTRGHYRLFATILLIVVFPQGGLGIEMVADDIFERVICSRMPVGRRKRYVAQWGRAKGIHVFRFADLPESSKTLMTIKTVAFARTNLGLGDSMEFHVRKNCSTVTIGAIRFTEKELSRHDHREKGGEHLR